MCFLRPVNLQDCGMSVKSAPSEKESAISQRAALCNSDFLLEFRPSVEAKTEALELHCEISLQINV